MSLLGRCCLENRSRSRLTRLAICVALGCGGLSAMALAQNLAVPRRHDRPPGPPLSPAEAVAKMTVPEGFSVEVVASEPDVMNPVAMFIDEKGRYWITESFEYPRREPGPGRDRIKVLEDTDGDGKVDKVTVFAEGLNIPSGIAVGYGGVWVANSPDILFLQDTDGDLKADKQEVIVTGFGRTDTHELPNSFTWGPDGWLYGLNGVFNYCDVKYAETNPNFKPDHPGWKFTCAMWRIHPRTREFQIFAEGTSNPWGIAINDEGDFFISACVIDHLWHIVETGYYIRQGGPYPPHTWPIRSIVDHKHQKAAYCGITWFDSDVYPEEYRRVLYMGNIHGGCINADVIARSGSTYKGKPHPGFTAKPQAWKDDEYGTIAKTGDPANPKLADFLTANDPWFMPVVQTTGPDGCLYILDWYDRYHCYQDANADPAGIERERGRLYRVRYQDTPHAQPIDLGRKSDEELIALLGGPNEYVRSTARRLLTERASEALFAKVQLQIGSGDSRRRRQAAMTMTSLVSMQPSLSERFQSLTSLLVHPDPVIQYIGLRGVGNLPPDVITSLLDSFRSFDSPPIRLQRLILELKSRRGTQERSQQIAIQLFADDLLVQQVAWRAMTSLVQSEPERILALHRPGWSALLYSPVIERATTMICATGSASPDLIARFVEPYLGENRRQPGRPEVAAALARSIQDGVLRGERLEHVKVLLFPTISRLAQQAGPQLGDRSEHSVLTLAALVGVRTAQLQLGELFRDTSAHPQARVDSFKTLVTTDPAGALAALDGMLTTEGNSAPFMPDVINAAAQLDSPSVGESLLRHYGTVRPDSQIRILETLAQRPVWSKSLLIAIQAQQVSRDALNLNQLRRIATFKDESVQALLKELYGAIREGRDPEREQVVNKTRDFLNGTPGDPVKGEAIFKKVCAQCHKLHGEGADVGPDLTRNGRNDWSQLLANVLDPSQVIGPGYQARILVTDDGRTLTGLPVEESETQVVLKVQGGKLETIPRDQIEVYKVSELSMMPDQLEKQVTPQELADLMSFLAHDRHPRDPEAKLLPGAPNPRR